ncbi:DNA cytosine methyltransferase [Streptomyces sp. NPDC007063]|uniref:DNA cytosine methyltransferase n=1 Tax=Streptomyces sp. NPDC007063 TaxID=3364772 RepID=UPI00368E5203
MAVCDVLGASVAWHCQYDPDDRHQYAARILAHHWPDVPNHGDITAVDWPTVEPVDILTAGFPCQDVSLAGLRAGIADGTRSGLWTHVARAISTLRPRLVVIENVPGLLSSPAARGVGPNGAPLDESGTPGTLRALGAVLGDLAGIGFDAEWAVVPASAVLAPHRRKRIFLLAWPSADPDDERSDRARIPGGEPQRHVAGPYRATDGPAREVAENPDSPTGRERRKPTPGQAQTGRARANPRGRSRALVADSDGDLHTGRDSARAVAGTAGADEGTTPQHGRPGNAPRTGGAPVANAQSERRGEGGTEPARQQGRSDVVECSSTAWGPYASAVARWEAVSGQPAPRPTDDRGRLTPALVEWMMGLPPGHVTDVPGLSRPAQLKALGNGVVPPQAAHAVLYLLHRASIAERFGLAI